MYTAIGSALQHHMVIRGISIVWGNLDRVRAFPAILGGMK